MLDRNPTARRLVCTVVAVLATTAALTGCAATRPHAAHRHSSRPAPGIGPGSRIASLEASPTASTGGSGTPPQGRLLTRTIPGGASGFAGRPAEVYLPPRALEDRHARLPVVELFHGVPGAPTDWLLQGQLLNVANAFASAHGGQSPIIVMPDINGAQTQDTECIRTPGGADVEQYLAQIVPAWITQNLPATTDHRRWLVAGLSEGGTCAAMLALRHPQVFSAFGDLSGLAQPTVGKVNDPPLTISELFGGSVRAYDTHDPLWLMRHRRAHTTAAWIAAGADDRNDRANESALAGAAVADGIPVRAVVVPGGHHWAAWTSALEQMLLWSWRHVGSG